MKKTDHETYLGDVICNSGRNEKNILVKLTKEWVLSVRYLLC